MTNATGHTTTRVRRRISSRRYTVIEQSTRWMTSMQVCAHGHRYLDEHRSGHHHYHHREVAVGRGCLYDRKGQTRPRVGWHNPADMSYARRDRESLTNLALSWMDESWCRAKSKWQYGNWNSRFLLFTQCITKNWWKNLSPGFHLEFDPHTELITRKTWRFASCNARFLLLSPPPPGHAKD